MADEPKRSLSTDDKEKVVAWINEKKQTGHELTCAVCGSKKWGIANDLVTPVAFVAGELALGGAAYPLVMLICRNCSHSIFLNAIVMGIYKEPTSAETPNQGRSFDVSD